MKKALVLISSAIFLTLCLWGVSSCRKKIIRPTYATPSNVRIASYNEIYTVIRPGALETITDNYRFVYNGDNRVSQIFYTTNDSDGADKNIVFNYVNDTIFKIIRSLKTTNVIERDTFIRNSSWQIIAAYFPNLHYKFSYFGKLLARETIEVSDSGSSLSTSSIYTADNVDFLRRTYDGVLSLKLPDSGYVANPIYHDTAFKPPIEVTWTTLGTTVSTVTRTINSYTDKLENYTSGAPVLVQAKDANGVRPHGNLYWPGGMYPIQNYDIHYDLANRPGDYLHIQSFTTYGINIYQNQHLVWKIRNSNDSTEANYVIDADSKITQTNVTITLPKNLKLSRQFNIQYETF